jgi:chromosome partitioning protein
MDEPPIASAARTAAAMRTGVMPELPRPNKRRTMVVANQKGGVGKTTSTVNLAAALSMHGLQVLVIDLDPQGNASTALGIPHQAGTPSIYDVLVDGVAIKDVVSPVPGLPNLTCVPATIDLSGAELDLVELGVGAREARLSRALEMHDVDLDYVFIDCPPSLGLLTVNALVAATEVLVPVQCEYYALEGLTQLLRTIEMVKTHLSPTLVISTILLTMYDGRTRLAENVASDVRAHFGDTVLRTAIPRSVRLSEAPSYGQTVMTYDPGSPGALSYLEAAREIARSVIV